MTPTDSTTDAINALRGDRDAAIAATVEIARLLERMTDERDQAQRLARRHLQERDEAIAATAPIYLELAEVQNQRDAAKDALEKCAAARDEWFRRHEIARAELATSVRERNEAMRAISELHEKNATLRTERDAFEKASTAATHEAVKLQRMLATRTDERDRLRDAVAIGALITERELTEALGVKEPGIVYAKKVGLQSVRELQAYATALRAVVLEHLDLSHEHDAYRNVENLEALLKRRAADTRDAWSDRDTVTIKLEHLRKALADVLK